MFVDDIRLSDCYYGILLRSPVARGTLIGIECPHLSTQYNLVQAKDIPGENILLGTTMPILAETELSYVGQPCAILTGPDMVKLESYAAQCKVLAEEACPVFSAQTEGAEVFEQETIEQENSAKSNPAKTEADGEASTLLPVTIEGSYVTNIQEHWYSEPHGAAVRYHDDAITIHTASQWVSHVKDAVVKVLNVQSETIIVEEACLGVHLDGKIWSPSLLACQAALAAFVTKSNIKLMLSRHEDFLYSSKRAKVISRYKSELDETGTITATDIHIQVEMGAFGIFTDTILDEICRSAYTLYKLGTLSLRADAVKTNIPPASPFDGFGAASGTFALERHIAKIIDTIQDDGANWRKNHLQNRKGTFIFPEEIIASVVQKCDYKRKWASYELLRRKEKTEGEKISPMRGIGIALGTSQIEHTFTLEDSVGITAQKQKVPEEKNPLAACAAVEIEIDPIEFAANMRGIWIAVKTVKIEDKKEARHKIICALNASLGWAFLEKIDYIDGKIFYGIKGTGIPGGGSGILPVMIEFVESEIETAGSLEEIPYGIFSAAYLQAVSQAVDHAFDTIPISAADIWQAINTRSVEQKGEEQ